MADTDGPKRDYQVGYGRPPRSTQFEKGRSGNPKGRPKGTLNLSTLIDKELNQRVTINENGVRKRISKKQAIAKQIVNKAAGGDPKVIPILITEERSRDASGSSTISESAPLPEEDRRVMQNLIARIRNSEPLPQPLNDTSEEEVKKSVPIPAQSSGEPS